MKPAALSAPAPREASPLPRRTEWSPNLWLGCNAFAWGRLLVRNGFAVHRTKWRVAAAVSAMSLVHTALRLVQQVFYGQQMAHTPIPHAARLHPRPLARARPCCMNCSLVTRATLSRPPMNALSLTTSCSPAPGGRDSSDA